MKHVNWFEHISATSRTVIFTLRCAGAFATYPSAQRDDTEGSTRGFSLSGHVAIIGVTGRRPDFDAAGDAIDSRGAGVSVGGGVLCFLSRSLALDAALVWTPGDLERYADGKRVKGVEAIGVSGTRVLIGVRWFPGR